MPTDHNFAVYAADTSVQVNGAAGSSEDFIVVGGINSITLNQGGVSQLTVSDNNGDGYLHGDNCVNETSDDSNGQTVNGTDTYADYEIKVQAPDGAYYKLYVIDVGESPSSGVSANNATTFLAIDPDNPPPEGVELTFVSFKQTPKIAYDDFEVPCFARGTELQMADGTFKAVEDIEAGDVMKTSLGAESVVVWAGNSPTSEPLYKIMNEDGLTTVVTKNHGVYVRLLDNTMGLAPAKFLTEAQYGEFLVTEEPACDDTVYHIMLGHHDLLITRSGLMSESYYCGGYATLPEASAVYSRLTGETEMELVAPRVKRKDIAEILELRTTNRVARAA